MKFVIKSLAIAAMLCSTPAVFADFVIDNFATPFTTPPAVQGQNQLSPIQATGVNGVTRILSTASQVTATGSTVTMNNAGNKSFELIYNLQSPTDLNSVNNVLQFSYSANNTSSSGFNFTFSVLNSFNPAGGANVLAQILKPLNPVSGTVSVSSSEFGNGLVMSSVQYLSIIVNRPNNAQGSDDTTFSFSTFKAVPEPATMTLLGLTGIAGVIAYRRRKSQVVA